MKPAEFEQLKYRVEDGVAWVQLNRPEARNAFSSRLYGELKWAIRAADFDESVDVIVVTGVDKAFATGGDLKETLARLSSDEGPIGMFAFTDNLPWDALRESTKVVIAAINGFCYAGGLITAMWCDIQIAVESARFALTEGKVGIADQMAPTVLFGRVPAPKLKYMLFTATPFSAADAERWGLITEVVPDDRLEARVREVIGEVRGTSPVSRKMFKRYLNELVPRPWNHGGTEAFASAEVFVGLSAFAEKRLPDYRSGTAE
jgi:enoyl-CoA hydratase/carnithine racemase